MKVVMIHEITKDILSKDLSDFDIITFDDGLYSQYTNLRHFIDLPQPKIFFISTNIICPENITQNDSSIYCAYAHEKAFEGNFEDYMKWSQIKDIYNTPNCFIGGHSHNHTILESLSDNLNDTKTMLKHFKEHNILINSYCFPYNNANSKRHISLLANKIHTIYGKERIPIESL